MNYEKVYNQIVERGKERKLTGYKEKHHIVPKCLGGNNSKENLVELTAREHFLCHWLLSRIHPKHFGLANAFLRMCKGSPNQQRNIQSGRAFEEAKKKVSFFLSQLSKGRKHTEETKRKCSEAKLGNDYGKFAKGKKCPEHLKEYYRNLYKGKKLSKETIEKRIATCKLKKEIKTNS